jgi:putative DNA primase/helicase
MRDSESPEAAANKARIRALQSFELTDAGNAEAFELLHGHRFRFNHDNGKWRVWTGLYWAEDKDGEADRAALETARARLRAAALISDSKDRDKAIEWARRSESVWGREAMLKSARSIRSLATTADHYDRDQFLLTAGNGTLDLRTGELREARPEDLITRATDVLYHRAATLPRWIQFLAEIFEGDLALTRFIQRAVGYSLTGHTREHCLFILYGEGSNGKTTFLETLLRLLGTYGATTPFSTVMIQRNPGRPRNDLAALRGTRLVKAAEAEHQNSLAEAFVKEITGGDTVTARFLFEEYFSFKPTFKLWLATNHKPRIHGADEAIWRRIRLIPFRRQFSGEHRDIRLREKLDAELPGIFAWAVEGCLAWQKEGLGRAPAVESATHQYRQECDQVGRFLNERCAWGPEYKTAGKELYKAYLQWCALRAEKPLANNVFVRELGERGIKGKRGRKGVIYRGLGVVPTSSLAGSVPLLPKGERK